MSSGRGIGRVAYAVRHLLTPHAHASTPDTPMETNRAGVRAVWLSLAVLAGTAAAQAAVFALTGSVALLSDTLHNLADALTALPVGLAFLLGRRPATRRFTYGYGRAEDLAGVLVVGVVAASAIAAAVQSSERLAHPATVAHPAAVAAAALVGFAGNELAARVRVRVGRRIGSAALVADGLHARTDALTSLAVLLSAGGSAVGWRWLDPLAGVLIAALIALVALEASRQVFARLMDAVDPELVRAARSALSTMDGVEAVDSVRMRWIGHTLHAEVALSVPAQLTLGQAHAIADDAEHRLRRDLRHLASATVHAHPADAHRTKP